MTSSANLQNRPNGLGAVWGAMPPAARIALVAIVAFLIGFGWQYASAYSRGKRLDATNRELRLARLEGMLALAVIEAQRGNSERARQEASAFYTEAQRAVTAARASAGRDATLTEPEETLRQILQGRDSTVTLLSRSDAAATTMLARQHRTYRGALYVTPASDRGGPCSGRCTPSSILTAVTDGSTTRA